MFLESTGKLAGSSGTSPLDTITSSFISFSFLQELQQPVSSVEVPVLLTQFTVNYVSVASCLLVKQQLLLHQPLVVAVSC